MIHESGVQVQIGVTLAGVLVAVSIPIFTNQLKKARLATNQANARAAYAAATAAYLDEDETPTADVSYEYNVKTAVLGSRGTGGTAKLTDPIADWGVGDKYDDTNELGSKTADSWVVELKADGSLKGFTGK